MKYTDDMAKGWLYGWNLVFDDQLVEPARHGAGLLLRDDADLGYVTSAAKIRAAVAEPTPARFRELLD